MVETVRVPRVLAWDEIQGPNSHRPEQFKKGFCAKCGDPLSRYNPTEICAGCRSEIKKCALKEVRAGSHSHYWNKNLVVFRDREPLPRSQTATA